MWQRGNAPGTGRTGACLGRWFALLGLVGGMLLGGCAPKRVVYLPQDWHAPPPVHRAQPDMPAGESQKRERVEAPSTVGKPILSQARIKESELPSDPKAGSAVEAKPAPSSSSNHGSAQSPPHGSGAISAAESGGSSTPGSTPKPPPAAVSPSGQTPAPVSEPPVKRAPVPDKVESATPQHYASMHLVDQAKVSLSQGKPDAAISVYEQAVQVDAYNGEAFLGLAKAWHMKGADAKSLEFAKKAEILFQDKPSRLKEVYLLQADIHKRAGNTSRMKACMQKASRL